MFRFRIAFNMDQEPGLTITLKLPNLFISPVFLRSINNIFEKDKQIVFKQEKNMAGTDSDGREQVRVRTTKQKNNTGGV